MPKKQREKKFKMLTEEPKFISEESSYIEFDTVAAKVSDKNNKMHWLVYIGYLSYTWNWLCNRELVLMI